MDVGLLLGRVDNVSGDPLDSLIPELTALLGVQFQEVRSGGRTFLAHAEEFKVWVSYEPEDEEPSLSHPFQLELATEKGCETEVGERLYEQLAETGRFRVVLLVDFDCVKSTHLPCDSW